MNNYSYVCFYYSMESFAVNRFPGKVINFSKLFSKFFPCFALFNGGIFMYNNPD